MSFSSDDSLGDLPLPYDISSAVSRALRINSTGSTSPDDGSKVVHPSNSLTAVDTSSHSIKAQVAMPHFNRSRQPSNASYVYENTLQPNFTTPTGPHQYPTPGQPAIYDQFGMEAVDAWNDSTVTVSICRSSESMLDSQNDMEQLDQFCSYIVSNSDEELPLENNNSSGLAAAPIYPSNSFPGPAYYYQYPPVGLDSPPRKKQRSTTSSYRDYHYPTSCSSTESSPEKCVGAQNAACWTMRLENLSLWRQFDQIGTEMVITKGGR